MFEFYAGSPLLDELRQGLCHVTSKGNFNQIMDTGVIQPNMGQLPFSHSQSKDCNALHLGAVSILDLQTPSLQYILELTQWVKWSPIVLRHNPAIILRLQRRNLPQEVIDHEEAKRRVGMAGGGGFQNWNCIILEKYPFRVLIMSSLSPTQQILMISRLIRLISKTIKLNC